MDDKKTENSRCRKTKEERGREVISYRLKCKKTANGLSHFVMYGDVPREKTLL